MTDSERVKILAEAINQAVGSIRAYLRTQGAHANDFRLLHAERIVCDALALTAPQEPAPREERCLVFWDDTDQCQLPMGHKEHCLFSFDKGARPKPTDAREVMKDWPDWKKGTIRAVYQRETPRTLDPTDAAKCEHAHRWDDDEEDYVCVYCGARTPATGE